MTISASTKCSAAKDAVLLVDGAGGEELGRVRDALTQTLDTPTLLITHADLASAAFSFDLDTGLVEVDGQPIRPVVVWLRHTSAAALVARAPAGSDHRALGAVSWSQLLVQVAASAHAALPGSPPAGPGQLVGASRLGVAVPRTVVATDVAAAATRLAAPRIVVKTQDFRLYESDRHRWPSCLPRIVDRERLEDDRGGPPRLVQEYVTHDRELRVYYLNGGICAFEIHKPHPSSLWTDPDSVTVAAVDCPAAAVTVVRGLSAAWGLRFAAFDLLVTPACELVFLEVNADGDWLWFERKAHWHGVSFMAAVMVRELFRQALSLGDHGDDPDLG